MLLVAIFWLAQIEASWRGPHIATSVSFVGVILALVGIGLRAAAIRTLGRYFISDIRVERIVRTGVYRWMRHPSEIGLIFIAVGVPLILESRLSASLALLLLTPLSLWRIRREESVIN